MSLENDFKIFYNAVEHITINNLHEHIKNFTNKSKDSEKRIKKFLWVNGLSSLEDCKCLKTLNILFNIEEFMFNQNRKIA
jgi:hypothetical protein